MGNRAVLTTKDRRVSCYLHWNGSIDTIEPLLKYCELKGYRSPETDSYGWARVCQVLGNFFGGTCSIGIDAYSDDARENPGDNGIYVIGDSWKIVDRIYPYEGYEEFREHDFAGMLRAFDDAMPESERLGEFLESVEIPACELEVGDEVWLRGIGDSWEAHEVAGFGKPRSRHGKGPDMPYVKRFDHDGDWLWNANNFVEADTVRIRPRG